MQNKTEYNAYMSEYMKNRFIALKIRAIKYKGDVCSKCNTQYKYPCYDFHHTDPNTKEFIWGQLRNKSWDKIKQELDKCVLLCANCHRLEHSHASNIPENLTSWFDESEIIRTKIPKEPYVQPKKIEWPSVEEMTLLVSQSPMSKISKNLGVSDKAIAKYCAKHNIQKPPRGHWTKMVGLEGSGPSSIG